MPTANRRFAPLAIAIGTGLGTVALLVSEWQTPRKAQAVTAAVVVVAKRPLAENRAIVSQDLECLSIPSPLAGAFRDPESLVGRVPAVDVPAGQPILSSHLTRPGVQEGLWYQVKPGLRAVTVAANEVVGVGGFLKTGLNVDVIGVVQDDLTWVAHTIAEDITVLAIAQNDRRRKDDPKAQVATSATLMVTPAQAEAISLASERGRIRLVLRAPGDHHRRTTAPALPAAAPRASAKPQPAPAPTVAKAPTVQVICGSEVRYVTP